MTELLLIIALQLFIHFNKYYYVSQFEYSYKKRMIFKLINCH